MSSHKRRVSSPRGVRFYVPEEHLSFIKPCQNLFRKLQDTVPKELRADVFRSISQLASQLSDSYHASQSSEPSEPSESSESDSGSQHSTNWEQDEDEDEVDAHEAVPRKRARHLPPGSTDVLIEPDIHPQAHPLADLSFTLELEEDSPPSSDITALAYEAFAALVDTKVNIIEQHKPKEHVLTLGDAEKITVSFFGDMIGTILDRIEDLRKESNSYVFAKLTAGHLLHQGSKAPVLCRLLRTDVAFLSLSDTKTTKNALSRNIHLVYLEEHWAEMREALSDNDENCERILRWLRLVVGDRKETRNIVTTTRISEAKTNLCMYMGITESRFTAYLKSATIPSALKKTWGWGALVFVPNKAGGNRHKFPCPDAAEQYFQMIWGVDNEERILNAATYVETQIMHVGDDVPSSDSEEEPPEGRCQVLRGGILEVW